jgi:hypothetical protein
MDLFLVTHPPISGDDRLFMNVAGRLIPVTRSAVDRLAGAREREMTLAARPKNACASERG